ncbi:MAG: glycerophosphodiester phosphodiesterase [Sphaerochaetaceae bacterium]|nr:glycerophosphodiester phosphodiesterase [Sphaerochaetaceae bacterium]
MLIFGHRGFSGKYPENTMLSFSKAVEAGAHGIELDVHLTKDGKPVIIHDESLKRTTGMDGNVNDYYFDDIVKINAGKTFDDKHGFTPIPSLDEYCSYISKTDVVTNIEIKTNLFYYPNIEEIVVDFVKRYDLVEKVIISSFNWVSVLRTKNLMPELECGLLQETYLQQNAGLLAKSCKVEYFHPDIRLMNDFIVKDCKDNGIGINSWTINTEEQFKTALKWNFRAAITNYPDLGLSLIN